MLHAPEQIGRAHPPLGTLAAGRITRALEPTLAAALAADRATRDRLVIFDPPCAPLLRPLVAPDDLRPWCAGAAGRWIIAVPRSAAAHLGARHPNLAAYLGGLAPPEPGAVPERGGEAHWWALPDDLAMPPAGPRIILGAGGRPCAWDERAALVAGPATVIAGAEPYWLALLGSRVGGWLLGELGPEAFPVPEAPAPARANLEGLALGASTLAAQIDRLEREVLRRLLADFGPPGAAPGPRLRRWWQLTFEELHAAVRAELDNDIPARFQPTWAEIHRDERSAHADGATRLAQLQDAIDAQAAALYGAREAGGHRAEGAL